MSKISNAANGVVDVLQSNGYDKAVLNYAPALLMAEGTEYALTVTPVSYGAAEERNRVSRRVKIAITLIVKVDNPDEFEIYNEQIEEITELFYLKQLPNIAGINCDGFEVNPMGSDLRYRETGQYLAHIVLEFITI